MLVFSPAFVFALFVFALFVLLCFVFDINACNFSGIFFALKNRVSSCSIEIRLCSVDEIVACVREG